jgi:hypothetical protein
MGFRQTHHEDVGRRLDHLVQADNVRVHEEAQDLDFAAHCARDRRQRLKKP